MDKISVQDLMTKNISTAAVMEDLATVSELMEKLKVRHIPIVDEEGGIRGLVSQRDMVRGKDFYREELPPPHEKDLLRTLTAGDIMTKEVKTVGPHVDIAEAARLILESKLGCLPVVDQGRVVGILTESDFVKYVQRLAEAAPSQSRAA